jgi:hypothetical protein
MWMNPSTVPPMAVVKPVIDQQGQDTQQPTASTGTNSLHKQLVHLAFPSSTNDNGLCWLLCCPAAGGYSTGYEHDPKEKAKYTDADNANFNP